LTSLFLVWCACLQGLYAFFVEQCRQNLHMVGSDDSVPERQDLHMADGNAATAAVVKVMVL
jgi:hypothetical protein